MALAGGSSTLVAYLSGESPDSERRFYERNGFEVLSRVRRDWYAAERFS